MRNGFAVFFVTLLLLALLRIFIGFVSVPEALILPASLLTTAVFIALPIVAVFRVATEEWTTKLAAAFLVAGLLVHFGLLFVVRSGMLGEGIVPAIATAISQSGFFLWCVGLGALINFLLKDKNLLIPVSIFLVAFDIFLVLTPIGITQQVMQQAPGVLPAVAYNVPMVTSEATGGPARAFGYVGPADFLFMGMFFVALHRFKLRARDTAIWLIPAVLVYLLLILVLPAVPLLVPIGLTVLIVNWREFQMTKEEKLSTAIVALVLIAAIAFGATRPRTPAGPLKPGDVRVVPESEDSLGPAEAVPVPSQNPSAPGSTPNPP